MAPDNGSLFGLNLKVDGSQDSHNQCFNKDHLYAAGYEKLQQTLRVRHDSLYNVNPFNESNVEDRAQEFNLIDQHNDWGEPVDIEYKIMHT